MKAKINGMELEFENRDQVARAAAAWHRSAMTWEEGDPERAYGLKCEQELIELFHSLPEDKK